MRAQETGACWRWGNLPISTNNGQASSCERGCIVALLLPPFCWTELEAEEVEDDGSDEDEATRAEWTNLEIVVIVEDPISSQKGRA